MRFCSFASLVDEPLQLPFLYSSVSHDEVRSADEPCRRVLDGLSQCVIHGASAAQVKQPPPGPKVKTKNAKPPAAPSRGLFGSCCSSPAVKDDALAPRGAAEDSARAAPGGLHIGRESLCSPKPTWQHSASPSRIPGRK